MKWARCKFFPTPRFGPGSAFWIQSRDTLILLSLLFLKSRPAWSGRFLTSTMPAFCSCSFFFCTIRFFFKFLPFPVLIFVFVFTKYIIFFKTYLSFSFSFFFGFVFVYRTRVKTNKFRKVGVAPLHSLSWFGSWTVPKWLILSTVWHLEDNFIKLKLIFLDVLACLLYAYSPETA